MQTITLTITNIDRLPDGGPTSFTATGGRFEIGRDTVRDWSLPDAQLHISGRHCEIAFERGAYVLNDVSRNGTFVNGSTQRVKSPHVLRNGDVLTIGQYIIQVRLAEIGASVPMEADRWPTFADDDIWGEQQTAPPPMDRRVLETAPRRPSTPDFVESHLDMPLPSEAHGVFDAAPAPVPSFTDNDTFGHLASVPKAPDFLAAAPARPLPASPVPQPPRSFAPSPPPPVFQARPQQSDGGREDRLLSAFREGARLPPSALANRDPAELFRELGAMMIGISEQVTQLLRVRASAKAMVKTSDRTMIAAMDNNPMKFMPDPVEALQIMLSHERAGYLDGQRAFKDAFDDLRRHEIATYAAMQKALARLLDDLSPNAVESKVAQSPFSNPKAKAWETFVARWDAKAEMHANGMLDVFLTYFSEAYQQMNSKER